MGRNTFPIIGKRATAAFCSVVLLLFIWQDSNAQSSSNYVFTTNTAGSLIQDKNSNFINFTGAQNLIANGQSSANSVRTEIGFDYFFMGKLYTHFIAGNDGQLALGISTSSTAILSTTAANDLTRTFNYPPGANNSAVLAAFWDNLITSAFAGSNTVRTTLSGTAPNRCRIIEWNAGVTSGSTTNTPVSDAVFQIRIYETSGQAEYVYGNMNIGPGSAVVSASIGFTAGATDDTFFAVSDLTTFSGTTIETDESTAQLLVNSSTPGPITELNSNSDPNRRRFLFTPPVPAAPSGLSFISVTHSSMTLNWNDNASDELLYCVYRSTDNINFTLQSNLPANTSSVSYSNLTSGTVYYYKIIAVSEGASSSVLSGSQSTAAGSLSGTKTICAIGCDYITISSAFADVVVNGLNGNLNLELGITYNSAFESYPISISNINALPNQQIKIYPSIAVILPIVFTSSTIQTFNIQNSKYITIDGRPGASGSSKMIEINNTSVSGTAVRFALDATECELKYCTIKGVETSASLGVITFSTATNTGNDNNIIDNCDITSGLTMARDGIFSLGTSGKENSGNIISNCNVYDIFAVNSASNAINLSSGNTAWTITGNSIYQTSPRIATVGSAHAGIFINNSSSASLCTITNNYIGGSAPLAAGLPWTLTGNFTNRFVGIQLAMSLAGTNTISNNTIRNFSWVSSTNTTNSPGIFSGIYMSSGDASISNNIIGSSSGNGSISVLNVVNNAGGIFGIACGANAVANITGNTIGSITTSGLGLTGSITGISTSTGTVTISNNLIGSNTTSNSLLCSSGAANSANQIITGIQSAANSSVISGNTLANFTNLYLGTSSMSYVRGIVVTTGNTIIENNSISKLNSNTPNAATGFSSSIQGITQSSTSTSIIIRNNKIFGLQNTHLSNAVNVCGIINSCGSSGTNLIERNFIHSLVTSSSSSVVKGISTLAGNAVYSNNMIRLGIDENGQSIIIDSEIHGISDESGSNNFYHNSVFIGGDSVVSGIRNTYAFRSLVENNTRAFQNNIFVNKRSNASTGASHYAISLAGTSPNPAGLTLSHNIYFAPGNGGILGRFNSSDHSTLTSWQSATGLDNPATYANPNFIAEKGNSSDVNLHLGNTTSAEAAGTLISSVTEDFDGSLRTNLTPVDIGADAGNYNPDDLFTPIISYTALISTNLTSNRDLFVTISDNGTGVPTFNSNKPRIWYRQSSPNQSAWTSTPGMLNSGTGNNGTWIFTLDYALAGGTPAGGEIYQYYVVAQDQASQINIAYNPSAGALHNNVHTQITAPSVPNNFQILYPIPTNVNVGTGELYTSLTGANGLFNSINLQGLTGNTTVNVVSDLLEDGTVALSNGLNGFTLTIQSSSNVLRTISNTGDIANSMIAFDGVSSITIDGRNGGSGQYLRFVNTNTNPVNTKSAIEIRNNCTWITVRNCIIESNSSSSTQAAILLSDGENSVNILSNDIRNAVGAPGTAGSPANGIFSNSANNTVIISDNKIYNFSSYGMLLQNIGNDASISGNNIYNTQSGFASTDQTGIKISAGNNHSITNNYIGGSAPGASGSWINSGDALFIGISLSVGTASASNVNGNFIKGINLTGINTVNFNGILIEAGLVNVGTVSGNTIGPLISNAGAVNPSYTIGINFIGTSAVNIKNNNISGLTSSSTSSGGVIGICAVGAGNSNITFNTINTLNSTSINTIGFAFTGIYSSSSSTSQLIEGNHIYNIESGTNSNSSTIVNGIYVNHASAEGVISRNRIWGLNNNSTGSNASLNGIFINNGSWTISNNQITLKNTAVRDLNIRGIYNFSGNAETVNAYYNSILITGNAAAGINPTHCYLRGTNSVSGQVKNNLFYNNRSGGSTLHYAIGNRASVPSLNWVSNYNLYVTMDSSKMGEWGTGISNGFFTWKINSAGDASSYGDITANISPFFINSSIGDLNVINTSFFSWYVNGKGVQIPGISADYSSSSAGRSVLVSTGGTDIGSDEFTPTTTPPAAFVSGSHSLNGVEELYVANRKIATINWGGTGALPSFVTIQYYSGTNPPDVTNGGATNTAKYMNCYWKIDVVGGSAFSYTLTLHYDEALLGTVSNEASLLMAKKESFVPHTWNVYVTGSTNILSNTMTVTGLSNFSEFTGTDALAQLPVELLSFTGSKINSDVRLVWSTASEIQNNRFELERSFDGIIFTRITSIKGNNNSNNTLNYSYDDGSAFIKTGKQILYYRLKQIDNDATFEYSNVISVENDISQTQDFSALFFPNPFVTSPSLQIYSPVKKIVQINLTDLNSQLILQKSIEIGEGENVIILNELSELAQGWYILRLSSDEDLRYFKILKK